MATLDELGRALQAAHAAGDEDNAKVLAQAYSDAKSAPQAAPTPQDGIAADIAKSGATGLVKGVAGLADSASGIANLPGVVSPALAAQKEQNLANPNLTIPGTLVGGSGHDIADFISKLVGGFHTPQTKAGEYAQTVGEFAPAAAGGEGGLVKRAAQAVIPALTSETAGQITKDTPYEIPARIIGAAGGAGLVANAPRVAELAKSAVAGSGPTEAAQAAHGAGYVIPPAMASDKPGIVSQGLGMLSGKIKLQQAASAKNQGVTDKLAAQSLGLPDDVPLTKEAFEAVHGTLGDARKEIVAAIPQIVPDDSFTKVADSLGKRTSEAAKAFPGLVKNKEIEDLSETLSSAKPFSPQAGLELVRHLRSDASANLKAFNDPGKQALGLAQRQAADAVDDLIERNLETVGKPDLVNAYRDARQQSARAFDVESATDPATGHVNAKMIGALQKKGRPLSGQLQDIAEAARAFPKATQSPSTFGGEEKLSIMDVGAAGLSHGATIPLSLARPGARSALLSPTYQDMLMREPGVVNALGAGSPIANALAVPSAADKKALNSPVARR